MQIITGCTGAAHNFATDDAEINRMILGTSEIVLPTAQQLTAEMNGTNKVRIKAGSLLMQGRLAKTRSSEGYTEVELDSGTIGYYRYDLVVAEYYTTEETTTDTSGNEVTWTKEHIDLKAVKGTPDASQYLEPTITSGDIDSGQVNQMKLWGVKLNGINFDSLVDFRVITSSTALQLVTDAMTGIPEIATKAEADVNTAVTAGELEITNAKDNAIAAIMAAGGIDAYTKAQTDSLISGFKNITSTVINIPVASWDTTALTVTVACAGMTTDTTASSAIVSYDPATKDIFTAAGIFGSAQGDNTITFKCTTIPTAAVAVNVMVIK
ncbi:hypothetical protein [Aminicella lysinilytica]|uniref:Uncharacterized protein n=1 Tax=Aminicella lysinilytica TaxID=433323 RepID=A0A4R6QB10_9FIRM|nr:hypothetical protein [Aminicella lysinilytica]TDP59854.1 hypothetical protein EV211_10296 [Aminicella lysinilytica]